MEIKLKISGQSKLVDGLWLAEGKSGDGRKVFATLVQKGNNLVLQTSKHGKNQVGDCRATSWFGKGIVLKDTAAKAAATVTFQEVHADEIYIEKPSSAADKLKELTAQVEQLAKINQGKDHALEKATALLSEQQDSPEVSEQLKKLEAISKSKDDALQEALKQLATLKKEVAALKSKAAPH